MEKMRQKNKGRGCIYRYWTFFSVREVKKYLTWVLGNTDLYTQGD